MPGRRPVPSKLARDGPRAPLTGDFSAMYIFVGAGMLAGIGVGVSAARVVAAFGVLLARRARAVRGGVRPRSPSSCRCRARCTSAADGGALATACGRLPAALGEAASLLAARARAPRSVLRAPPTCVLRRRRGQQRRRSPTTAARRARAARARSSACTRSWLAAWGGFFSIGMYFLQFRFAPSGGRRPAHGRAAVRGRSRAHPRQLGARRPRRAARARHDRALALPARVRAPASAARRTGGGSARSSRSAGSASGRARAGDGRSRGSMPTREQGGVQGTKLMLSTVGSVLGALVLDGIYARTVCATTSRTTKTGPRRTSARSRARRGGARAASSSSANRALLRRSRTTSRRRPAARARAPPRRSAAARAARAAGAARAPPTRRGSRTTTLDSGQRGCGTMPLRAARTRRDGGAAHRPAGGRPRGSRRAGGYPRSAPRCYRGHVIRTEAEGSRARPCPARAPNCLRRARAKTGGPGGAGRCAMRFKIAPSFRKELELGRLGASNLGASNLGLELLRGDGALPRGDRRLPLGNFLPELDTGLRVVVLGCEGKVVARARARLTMSSRCTFGVCGSGARTHRAAQSRTRRQPCRRSCALPTTR